LNSIRPAIDDKIPHEIFRVRTVVKMTPSKNTMMMLSLPTPAR
jgi:hypothetical protein